MISLHTPDLLLTLRQAPSQVKMENDACNNFEVDMLRDGRDGPQVGYDRWQ
jgi:hypothetical protein